VILDSIVSPPWELGSYLFPFASKERVGLKELNFFFGGPGCFEYIWGELVMPPEWGKGYLSLICLEVRGVEVRFFISAAMVVHWLVPCFSMRARMMISSWVNADLPLGSTVFYYSSHLY
jgi:hypothetical protein